LCLCLHSNFCAVTDNLKLLNLLVSTSYCQKKSGVFLSLRQTKFEITFIFLSIFLFVRMKYLVLVLPYLIEFHPQLRGQLRRNINIIVIETGDRKLVSCGKVYVVEIRNMLHISGQKVHTTLIARKCRLSIKNANCYS
jgi:hypothetical protein